MRRPLAGYTAFVSDGDAPDVAASPPVTAMTLVAPDLLPPSSRSTSAVDDRGHATVEHATVEDATVEDAMIDAAVSPCAGDIAALEQRIASERLRAAAARERAKVRRVEVDAAVRAATTAADEVLAELDRRHAVIVAGIRSDACAVVERIDAAARRSAAAVDDGSVTDASGGDGAA
jgi:hypothetical protein